MTNKVKDWLEVIITMFLLPLLWLQCLMNGTLMAEKKLNKKGLELTDIVFGTILIGITALIFILSWRFWRSQGAI